MASKYAGIVQDELRDLRGNAMVGAVVIVRTVGTTTPATVYNNPVLIASAGGGDALINDAVTGLPAAAGLLQPGVDANGNYTFFADSDVAYDMRVVWQGNTFDYRVRPKVVDEAYTSTADLTAALNGTYVGMMKRAPGDGLANEDAVVGSDRLHLVGASTSQPAMALDLTFYAYGPLISSPGVITQFDLRTNDTIAAFYSPDANHKSLQIANGGDTGWLELAWNNLGFHLRTVGDTGSDLLMLDPRGDLIVNPNDGTGVARHLSNTGATVAEANKVIGEAADRCQRLASGALLWGDGTAPQDVRLERGGADQLKVSDGFKVSRGLVTQSSQAIPLDVDVTWSGGSQTFTAFKVNVTDTDSANGSALIDLQLGGVSSFKVDKDGYITIGGGFSTFEGRERTPFSPDPAAPAADRYCLYAKDNGSGKTQLCVRFNTGAVQVLATEP